MFYFDLETSVYSPAFKKMLSEVPPLCESFMYLGSYNQVVDAAGVLTEVNQVE